MTRLRDLIPVRPTDSEPIDVIPVVIAAGDLAAGLAGWAVVGGEALECSEVSVVGAIIGNYLNLGVTHKNRKGEPNPPVVHKSIIYPFFRGKGVFVMPPAEDRLCMSRV